MIVLLLILTFKLKTMLGEEGQSISCCKDTINQMTCLRGDCKSFGYTDAAGTDLVNNTARIYPLENYFPVQSISDRGLEVFKKYTSLIIDVEILSLISTSFAGINPEELSIMTREINKCAFYDLINLKRLIITGPDKEVNFHKDAFTGLANLNLLEYRNIKKIYTFPVNKGLENSTIACEHYLCALRNLSVLSMQVDHTCDVIFEGIPAMTQVSFFSIDQYTKRRRSALCPMSRHACHYDVTHRCGLRQVCVNESNEGRYPAMLVPILVAGVIVAAIGVAGLVYYFRSAASASGPAAVSV